MTDSAWWTVLVGVLAALSLGWAGLIAALVIVRPRDAVLRSAVRILPDMLRLIHRLARDPTLPTTVRIRLALLLAYLTLPVDLVPDVILVLGYAET